MTGGEDTDRDALFRLARALVADLHDASDAEMLAEAREDGTDPKAIAAEGRALLAKTAGVLAKGRLRAAKAAVDADRGRAGNIVELTSSQARRRLERLIAANPNAVTLAARKAAGEASDEEVRSLLEDLEDLGLTAPDEPGA